VERARAYTASLFRGRASIGRGLEGYAAKHDPKLDASL